MITPFVIASKTITCLAFSVGWFRGGHPERFGVGVLFLDSLATSVLGVRSVTGHAAEIVSETTIMLVFIWMALRSARWWPLAAAASLMLCNMVHLLDWATPEISRYAAESAQLGLWILTYLAVLAGAGERWLAGERAVSDAATWRRRALTS